MVSFYSVYWLSSTVVRWKKNHVQGTKATNLFTFWFDQNCWYFQNQKIKVKKLLAFRQGIYSTLYLLCTLMMSDEKKHCNGKLGVDHTYMLKHTMQAHKVYIWLHLWWLKPCFTYIIITILQVKWRTIIIIFIALSDVMQCQRCIASVICDMHRNDLTYSLKHKSENIIWRWHYTSAAIESFFTDVNYRHSAFSGNSVITVGLIFIKV